MTRKAKEKFFIARSVYVWLRIYGLGTEAPTNRRWLKYPKYNINKQLVGTGYSRTGLPRRRASRTRFWTASSEHVVQTKNKEAASIDY